LPIALQPVARDIVANVLDIAGEQGKRVGIETRVDRLGKVDDADLALPVKHIIGREKCIVIEYT